MRNMRPTINWIEMALLSIGIAVAGYAVGRNLTESRMAERLRPYLSGDTELVKLEETYGPARNSEHGEEWILRDFFQDQRSGVFADVGANHYRRDSNTYYLETSLGWSGVAVEPQTKFAADYAKYRPRTVFVPLMVSDVSNGQAILHVPSNDLVASSSQEFADAFGSASAAIPVSTTTLDDILNRHSIGHLDFLTMDIELGEPAALRGFSIGRFRPRLVCVEAHEIVRQNILDYFAEHGYVVVGKYLRADPANLWFTPRGTPDT